MTMTMTANQAIDTVRHYSVISWAIGNDTFELNGFEAQMWRNGEFMGTATRENGLTAKQFLIANLVAIAPDQIVIVR